MANGVALLFASPPMGSHTASSVLVLVGGKNAFTNKKPTNGAETSPGDGLYNTSAGLVDLMVKVPVPTVSIPVAERNVMVKVPTGTLVISSGPASVLSGISQEGYVCPTYQGWKL